MDPVISTYIAIRDANDQKDEHSDEDVVEKDPSCSCQCASHSDEHRVNPTGSDAKKLNENPAEDPTAPLRTPSLRGGGPESSQASSSKTFTNSYEFAKHVQGVKCTKCNKRVIENQEAVLDWFRWWYHKKASPCSSLLICKPCSKCLCIGCGRSDGKRPVTETTVSGIKLSYCCSLGRLYILWVWLCGFDDIFCASKIREMKKTGTGRRLAAGSGIGYNDDASFWDYESDPESRRPSPLKAKVQKSQQNEDGFFTIVFSVLKELLSTQGPELGSPEIISYMLLNSRILEKASELLRNDSLEDVTSRKDLYQSLLGLLRTINNHPAISSQVLSTGRPVFPDAVNILTLSFERSTAGKKETSSSIADCLRNIDIQSKTILKAAGSNSREFQSTEDKAMLSICRQISELADKISSKSSRHATKQGNENVDHGILEANDDLIFATHSYGNRARGQAASRPGRIKRIISDITSLKTGLPPGIFVKYASSRPDLMTIMIVGPSDTPYENGLFEFDLYCDQNYPFNPPKMKFKGTNGGVLDINPNLHSDGMVCLSILGTWPGEPWRPAQSTILQVLISIQAMIFNEHPMLNEPGSEPCPLGSTAEQQYNHRLRVATVTYAMCAHLRRPSELWKDVISLHFKRNADKILSQVSQWERAGASLASRRMSRSEYLPGLGAANLPSDMSAAFSELRRDLQRFGAISGNQGRSSGGRAYDTYGQSEYSRR